MTEATTTDRNTAPLDLRPLTTIRIFAALWVVLGTYWEDLRGTAAVATPVLIAHSQLGVELFFTLSGFILAHVYLTSFSERKFGYGRFLWARLARIYPLHVATLAAVGTMALLATIAHQKTTHTVLYWPALLPNILLTNAWGVTRDAGWNHPAWSISAEWFAYLLFPIFAAAGWAFRKRPIAAAYLAAILLVAIYPLFRRFAGFELTEATIIWGALRIVPCFAYGVAMNLLWRSNLIKSRWTAVTMSFAFIALSVAFIMNSAPPAAIVACFGNLILSLASLSSTGSRLFSNKIGVYLGEVSFAVYMVAVPWKILATGAAAKLLNMGDFPLPLWLAYFAAVVPVAMVGHHLVELPARQSMRRWLSQWTAKDLRQRAALQAV